MEQDELQQQQGLINERPENLGSRWEAGLIDTSTLGGSALRRHSVGAYAKSNVTWGQFAKNSDLDQRMLRTLFNAPEAWSDDLESKEMFKFVNIAADENNSANTIEHSVMRLRKSLHLDDVMNVIKKGDVVEVSIPFDRFMEIVRHAQIEIGRNYYR